MAMASLTASDISTIAANWLTNASSSASETGSIAGVPEPSTLVRRCRGVGDAPSAIVGCQPQIALRHVRSQFRCRLEARRGVICRQLVKRSQATPPRDFVTFANPLFGFYDQFALVGRGGPPRPVIGSPT